MAFTLHTTDAEPEVFDDGAKHQFDVSGSLVITLSDGTRRIYSPFGWRYIEVQPKTKGGRR